MFGRTTTAISMQFRTDAINGSDSLPLTGRSTSSSPLLLKTPLSYRNGNGQAAVQLGAMYRLQKVTTHLLAHGERVPAENHQVMPFN
jgi:hypothetical protein